MTRKNKSCISREKKGAYSHLACLEIFPNAEVTIACSTFEETFKLAKENSDYKIVIPIDKFFSRSCC